MTMRVSSHELNAPAENAPLCLWAEPRSEAMARSMSPPSLEKALAILDQVENSCLSVGGSASGAALLHAALALSRHSTNSGLADGSGDWSASARPCFLAFIAARSSALTAGDG